MASAKDYQIGAAALASIVAAAIKAHVPEFFQGDIPPALVAQLEQLGAKAVIDAVDRSRAADDAAKGLD